MCSDVFCPCAECVVLGFKSIVARGRVSVDWRCHRSSRAQNCSLACVSWLWGPCNQMTRRLNDLCWRLDLLEDLLIHQKYGWEVLENWSHLMIGCSCWTTFFFLIHTCVVTQLVTKSWVLKCDFNLEMATKKDSWLIWDTRLHTTAFRFSSFLLSHLSAKK